jgi:serine/threonine-protein kinase
MGVVRLARDMRIDREVAVKLMHPTQRDPQTIARFFREAQIQGALEHPAVVPVHDLGVDPEGNPYFVMKRLAGVTLADVIERPEVMAKWPRRLLLTRFVDVCLAVELAHTRGIVHRDLKPANLMLGDFGEAYILDWGLARIVGDVMSSVAPLTGEREGETQAGSLLGTPGYMAPEQVRGEDIGPGTDVFALGCVLFEILAGKPALPRGAAALAVTLEADKLRPSALAPQREIPPELDDLCARATSRDRAARPSARELGEAIQAYLDGDRDVERRRELAAAHARRAEAALAESGDEARALAMREAGRALVLDPESAVAQDVLGHLMLEAPAHQPAEALAASDQERTATLQAVVRRSVPVYIVIACLLVFAFVVLPVREPIPIFIMIVLALATAVLGIKISVRSTTMRTWSFWAALLVNGALLGMSALVFGPMFIAPLYIVGSLGSWLSQPSAYPSWITIVSHLIPFAIVLALEILGVVPPTFHLGPHGIELTSWVIDLTPTAAIVVFSLALGSQLVTTTVITLTSRRSQEDAQNRIHVQRWHLQQLLPRRPKATDDPPTIKR